MVFDVTKPAERTRFNSEQIRDNFEAVGRASDLKCFAQELPNRTLYVQPGRFYTVTTASTLFPGGDTPSIDTTTGGLPGQERIVVVEITDAATLYLNYGAWAAAGSAVAPTYSPANIALAEALVTFNDQEITDDQITDVRPLINLGNTGTEIIAPELQYFTSTPGQTNYTLTLFTFVPNAFELLVWSGGVFQTPGLDYTEPNDHTVQFAVARPAGELVTVWKVGISAVPATMALADLSDVTNNEADAFHNADAATAINPLLTISGHAAIDHTALPFYTPIGTHLVTTATNPAMRHHASEIEATDNFTFSSATNVQDVLNDVQTNFYNKYAIEHKISGEHGPKVTITQANNDDALVIAKSGTAGSAIDVTVTTTSAVTGIYVKNSGPVNGILVEQGTASGAAGIRVLQNGNDRGITIDKQGTGDGIGLYVVNQGTDPGILIEQNGGDYALRIQQYGNTNAVLVEKFSTNGSSAIVINNSGSGYGLYVNCQGTGSLGVRIEQAAAAQRLLFLNKTNTGAGNVVDISNNGSGYDMRGHNERWNLSPSGHANFGNVKVGGGTGVSTGFFTLQQGANLTLDSTGGIVPTHSYHRVDTYAAAANDSLIYISAAGVPVGTILILQSVNSARNVFVRNKDAGGNIDLHGSDDFELNTTDATITLLRQNTSASSGNWEWVEITRSTQE